MAGIIISIVGLAIGVGGIVYAVIQGIKQNKAIGWLRKAVEGLLVAQQKSSYKAQNPSKPVTPEIQAKFISLAKEASSKIAAGGIPPAGTIITGDWTPE